MFHGTFDLKPIAGDRHARDQTCGKQNPEFCYNESRRKPAQSFRSVNAVNAKQERHELKSIQED